MFGKDDLIAGAFAVGAAVPAMIGSAVQVDGLQLVAAVGGGAVGAMMTARTAFDKTNSTPAALTALNCMISLTTGALAGMMLPHFLFSAAGIKDITIEVIRGVALLLGFGGEKIVALLMERVLNKTKG